MSRVQKFSRYLLIHLEINTRSTHTRTPHERRKNSTNFVIKEFLVLSIAPRIVARPEFPFFLDGGAERTARAEGKQTLQVIRFDLLSALAIKSTHSRSIKSIVTQSIQLYYYYNKI